MRVITFGRSSKNNVVVDDPQVSRHHVQIVEDDNGGYRISDIGSSNGTFVNEQQISGEVPLAPNDVVRIGNTVLPWIDFFSKAELRTKKWKKYLPWIIAGGVIVAGLITFGIFFGINLVKSKNARYVPNDAFAVTSLNLYQIPSLKKEDKKLYRSEMFEYLSQIENDYYYTAKIIEKTINNPKELGVDFRKNMYEFSQLDKNNIIMGMICTIDPSIFKSNFENLCKDFDLSDIEFNNRDDVTYCIIDQEVILGWKGNVLVVLLSTDGKISFRNLDNIFSQKKENSFIKNEAYGKFNKNRNFLNLYMTSNIINDIPDIDFQEWLGELYNIAGVDFSDNYLLAHIALKDGEFVFKTSIHYKKFMQSLNINKIKKNQKELENLFEDFYNNDVSDTTQQIVINGASS